MKPKNSIESALHSIKQLVPVSVFKKLSPFYHYILALTGAVRYGFPSQELTVIGVTGTKGKSTVVEMVNSILEAAGKKTILSNTIRFKIGDTSEANLYKMSMPGRGAIQQLFRKGINEGCTHAVLEITSQAVLTSRHRFIELDELIFTNISPEHIEAHGSFENYKNAKLEIAQSLSQSSKKHTAIIVNSDDEHADDFIRAGSPALPIKISLDEGRPFTSSQKGSSFMFEDVEISTKLTGEFNIINMLCAAKACRHLGISTESIKKGLESLTTIRGRVENVNEGGEFGVYIDYAHTADSLEQLYKAFHGHRIIAVLGNTGGGRDTWKRPVMAKIAEQYADTIFLTNEDPYDENPQKIVDEMAEAVTSKEKLIIELDRRAAISKAMQLARPGDVVLITGKGTDPYIMLANNAKIPWDDASVAREELEHLQKN